MCAKPTKFNSYYVLGRFDEAPLKEELLQYEIAVATVNGLSYYRITNTLKLLGIPFESLLPEQAALSPAKIIITTANEASLVQRKDVILDSEVDRYPFLLKAKILRTVMGNYHDDQLIIGVDPGDRIGISVIYLHDEIDSFVESSSYSAFKIISVLLSGIYSTRKIVRIGDGNLSISKSIATMLHRKFKDLVHVEIVNEYGTSLPKFLDSNRRGMRDKSSARAIALRKGRVFIPSRRA